MDKLDYEIAFELRRVTGNPFLWLQNVVSWSLDAPMAGQMGTKLAYLPVIGVHVVYME